MSDVEEIRQAAALMRARAEAGTPGPWDATAMGSEGYSVRADREPSPRRSRVWVARLGWEAWEVDRANAEHISSWHPAVALAVADWLDAEASNREAGIGGRGWFSVGGQADALNVARAYLGRSS